MQSNITTEEIFKILSLSDNYNLLSFIKFISENMNNDKNILTSKNLSYIRNNRNFSADEKELIINFLSVLGKSDLNGQLIHCKTYKEIFSKKLKENEDKETNNCKSSTILVFGIGFLIIILIN
jgi:stage III sporulation protein AB